MAMGQYNARGDVSGGTSGSAVAGVDGVAVRVLTTAAAYAAETNIAWTSDSGIYCFDLNGPSWVIGTPGVFTITALAGEVYLFFCTLKNEALGGAPDENNFNYIRVVATNTADLVHAPGQWGDNAGIGKPVLGTLRASLHPVYVLVNTILTVSVRFTTEYSPPDYISGTNCFFGGMKLR